MKTIVEKLRGHAQVSDHKINVHQKESYELFYVKGKLETVRRTDTCDKEITVYVKHGEYMGDAQFFVYPSTTEEQMQELIEEAVEKALLIQNKPYDLPGQEVGEYEVESNFREYDPVDMAALVAKTVFEANQVECGSLNSVEIFINKHTETVLNSRGLDKTQVRYDAMVEAIPTYNGEAQSVELYEQYNFSQLDLEDMRAEIAKKMEEVKARYEAIKPDSLADCKVILGTKELSGLFYRIASDLSYSSVYAHANLFRKGDSIQKAPAGDRIGITMAGEVKGCTRSAKFDQDGIALGSIRLVEDGKAVNYYGSNRVGQYLGEKPTGMLGCICVDAGTADEEVFAKGPYLEIISMSGLQVDFYSDYIGGEVRLAYYHDGEKRTPVTGISISGQLGQVLDHICLSDKIVCLGAYQGPEKAILSEVKVF